MTMLAKQNAEVYDEITTSGKSLLQLYLEMKDERDQLIVRLATHRMGIKYEPEFGMMDDCYGDCDDRDGM